MLIKNIYKKRSFGESLDIIIILILSLSVLIMPDVVQAQPVSEEKTAEVKPTAEETTAEEPAAVKKDDEKSIVLNFQNTDINMVLKFYSELVNMPLIKNEQVQGRITVVSQAKITKKEALRILDAVLELNGLTVVPMDGFFKVVFQKEALQKSIETRFEIETEGMTDDRMITQIIPLKFQDANTMQTNLRPIISPNGNIFSTGKTNVLVIMDTATNIKRLLEIINALDVDTAAGKLIVKILQLENADETELSELLNKIFSGQEDAATTTRAGVYRTPARRTTTAAEPPAEEKDALKSLIGQVKIIPYERLHALVIVTTEAYFETVKDLIVKLDVPGPESKSATRVYYLQNAKAKDTAEVLNSLFTGIQTTEEDKEKSAVQTARRSRTPVEETPSTNYSGIKGEVNLVADERTNALIISTHPDNFAIIEMLINNLDIRTPQVLIEAFIAEVTLTDETKFGIDWKWPKIKGSHGLSLNSTMRGNWENLTGTDPSFAQTGFSWWLKATDQFNTGRDVAEALLDYLAELTKVNVLSAPHILTSNNKEASIIVGNEVPVLKESQSTTTGGMNKSYEYHDVGVGLTVTPRIGNNADVALDIKQEINELGAFNSTLETYTFSKREAKTTVVVKDNQTMVIGGLIKDNKNDSVSKIPIAGDIPVLGFLFKKKDVKIEKTELLVFITPHVIFTPEKADEITEMKEKETKGIKFPENKLEKEQLKEYFDQGQLYYEQGQYGEAISAWEKAAAIDPDYNKVNTLIEKAKQEKEKIQLGNRYKEKLQEEMLRKKLISRYLAQGENYYHQKKYSLALMEMEKVRALDPDNKKAQSYLKKIQKKTDKINKTEK